MASTTVVTQGPSPEDYGLDVVAQHNAVTSTEQFPPYEEDAKGLGIYNDGLFQEDSQAYIHNPPTPRSGVVSEGVRTRSGRSTRRTDSPFSTSKSRVSKSPAAKSRKDKKPGKLDKSKTPKLTAPLSVLTKDLETPVKDMDSWVHRPAEVRRQEVEKRNGYVTRPMNSFMLYRSCYAERTKQWCLQNNHQVVSSVSGESWPMEPEEVRNQFNEWAKIERANHAAAHPEYKFSPSKANNKRKKGEVSDDDEEGSDLDGNPDGEYRGGSRSVRHKRHTGQSAPPVPYLPSNASPVGFDSHPYYDQQYTQPPFGYTSDGVRPLPSNVGYDGYPADYNPQTQTWLQPNTQQYYNYIPTDVQSGGMRVSTPSSMTGANQNLGSFGLPGGHISSDDLFVTASRTGTPAMQAHYTQYNQPIYSQYQPYTPQPPYQPLPQPSQQQHQQMLDHQQYLQQATLPQEVVDPTLEAELANRSACGVMNHEQSHFEDAMGDFGDGMGEYMHEPGSANQVMGHGWASTELGGQ